MSDLTTDERVAAVQALKGEYRRLLAVAVARKQIVERNPFLSDEPHPITGISEREQVTSDMQRNINFLEWNVTESQGRLKNTDAALDGAELIEDLTRAQKRRLANVAAKNGPEGE